MQSHLVHLLNVEMHVELNVLHGYATMLQSLKGHMVRTTMLAHSNLRYLLTSIACR
jgi:hypothetical protein